jgi:hypothetical protein
MVDNVTMGNMSKTFKVKLTGLGGVLVALVLTSGCMGGGGGEDTAKEYGQQICSSVARTCQDGSPAKKEDEMGCKQTCPEDKEMLDKLGNAITGTGTGTSTGTSTATATQLTCSSEVFSCPDGSTTGRDPGNGCKFKACPSN